ncbi:27060_t:CDS:2, partial [Gigaspora margarita]
QIAKKKKEKREKGSKQLTIYLQLSDFVESTKLTQNQIKDIDRALVKICNNNSDIVNTSVQAILCTRAFFDDLNALAFVLYPIKMAISTLESQDCSLANCFVGLVHLGKAIKKLPKNDYYTFYR